MKHSLIFAITCALVASSYQIAAAPSDINYNQAVKLKHSKKLPEAEQAFSMLVEAEATNLKALEQLAVVQSWQNKFDDAIANYKKLLSMDPSYTSARIGLARVSYWQGQREFALKQMKMVLAEQPKDPNNWTLQGDILLADKQYDAAKSSYQKAKMLLGANVPDALQQKISHAVAPKSLRLDAGYISDTYDAVRTDGHSSYLQLGYTFENHTTIYARAEEYLSFDSTDTGLTVGAYYSPHKSVLLNGEFYTNSGDANFRPNQQITINADFTINKNWQPLLGYRQATYTIFDTNDEGDVTTITPGLRYNHNDTSFEFKHSRTDNIDDTTTSTNTLKVNTQYQDIAPYVFITDGEEGIPPLSVAEITIVGAGAVYKFNNSLSLRADYSREDRKDTYIHHSFGMGVSYFF